MIDEGEDRAKGPTGGADEAERREAQPIPEPSPEEVPELLGERSDYPVPFGEEGEESGRAGAGEAAPGPGAP